MSGDSLEELGRHDSGSNGAGAPQHKPGKGRVAAAKRQAAGADNEEAEDDAGAAVSSTVTEIVAKALGARRAPCSSTQQAALTPKLEPPASTLPVTLTLPTTQPPSQS